ncbi:MAG: hypothetical protein MI717_02150 [Spirochaetales bacterium]|nr:hypothetical protein [Spirochaetales bacterium]
MSVLKWKKGFHSKNTQEAIRDLRTRLERLIFDHALNPGLLGAFEDRFRHAKDMGRDPKRYIAEEQRELDALESKAQAKQRQDAMRMEARRRQEEGQTLADRVLGEYRQRIDHYPSFNFHPDADFEVRQLYGALDHFDKGYYGTVESYLRRAFPQAGQLDRMSIEQRFWRFVSTRNGRVPDELERYRRALASPAVHKKELEQEVQEAIRSAAFFLHELLDLCEQAAGEEPPTAEEERAIAYIRGLIHDFRLKDLKRR